MNRFVLLSIAVCGFASSAVAEPTSGTPDDEKACRGSVIRFCAREIKGGDMMILGCLQQNRLRISKPCQQVLIKYGQ